MRIRSFGSMPAVFCSRDDPRPERLRRRGGERRSASSAARRRCEELDHRDLGRLVRDSRSRLAKIACAVTSPGQVAEQLRAEPRDVVGLDQERIEIRRLDERRDVRRVDAPAVKVASASAADRHLAEPRDARPQVRRFAARHEQPRLRPCRPASRASVSVGGTPRLDRVDHEGRDPRPRPAPPISDDPPEAPERRARNLSSLPSGLPGRRPARRSQHSTHNILLFRHCRGRT